MKEQIAEIVAAFLKRNQVASTELPALIASVHQALDSLGKAPAASTDTPAQAAPAVSIRQSIRPEYLVCLVCGRRSKSIKRHLMTAHGVTPDEYRNQWGLPRHYPMVAPSYAARRSELAKSLGLGRRGSHRPKAR